MSQPEGIGKKIKTPYGKATIISITSQGISIRLDEGPLSGQMLSFSEDEIKEMGISVTEKSTKKDNVRKKGKKLTSKQKSKVEKQLQAKSIIDALRFGLVPITNIDNLTLGFKDIKKWTDKTFPYHNGRENPVVHQIKGHFGEGKSHTMTVIRHLALKEGYVVAKVEVDGIQISFSKPKEFLHVLTTSIQGGNLPPVMALFTLYKKAIHSGKSYPGISAMEHERVGIMYDLIKLLDRHRKLDDCDYLIDGIITCSDEITASEAKRQILYETKYQINKFQIRLYPMIGRLVIHRPRNFLETLLGITKICQLAGYKGLIITIDEYEVESSLLQGRTWHDREIAFLELLIEYFKGKTYYPKLPMALYFASVPISTDDDMGDYSYFFKGLHLVELVDEIVQTSNGYTYDLDQFIGWDSHNKELKSLVKNIHELYKKAYNCQGFALESILALLSDNLNKSSLNESGGIRSFMKQYISLLDSTYGPPEY